MVSPQLRPTSTAWRRVSIPVDIVYQQGKAAAGAVRAHEPARRMVVKVGSQVVCETSAAASRRPALQRLVGQLAGLRATGWQVLLVSSGAVAAGAGIAGRRQSWTTR